MIHAFKYKDMPEIGTYHDYQAKCKMAKCCGHIDFSQKRCAKNFVISNDDTAHNAHDFRILLDYFRDQLLALGYCVQVSDCRTYHCSPTKQETIERHYLKPIAKRLPSGKLPQLFGNITLTLHCKNGEPAYLKCCAAHFRDVNLFEPVLPMSALIDCLTA